MKILHLVIITVFLITSAVLLTTPYHAYASACAVKETIYSAPEFFLLSDNVFVGNVTSITDYGNHQWQVHFNIEKIWKGFATRQTSTVMAYTLQACGYSITVGEKYLIYTNGSPSTINPISSKMYSDAQNDIALFDDPKFQAQEQVKEELNKKLEVVKDRVGSMMMDKSSHIPIVGVGVDQVNSTLDITIDDEKATLSVEQYTQNLKNILGGIPIKVEFGHATTLMPILHSVEDQGITTSYPIIYGSNSSNVLKSPLQQFKSGIAAKDVICKKAFELIIKSENNTPACVTQGSVSKLIERGWAILTTDFNKSWVEIDTLGLNKTYIVNHPIAFSVIVKGFGNYPCVSPQIKIHDNKNPNVSVFQDNGSTMSCPALKTAGNYSFDFPGSNSQYVIILNKTGNYTMTASYGDNSVQKYFSVVLPSDQSSITVLENNTGIVLLKNQTYYFETPNYTNDAYIHPVQVSFRDVHFILFPPGFRGGLPSGGCMEKGPGLEQYYWTDAKFADSTHELLHIFADSPSCTGTIPSMFSNHTNPQAGLTFYDGKMKLLVGVNNQVSSLTNYTKESEVAGDTTYLSQTVDEWKSKTPEQLDVYYKKYKDAFYTELGSFLIKNEMKKELERQKIQNTHDDFKVFLGMSFDSLPPHIGYDAVVNATDGNSYLLLGGVFANKIESLKITKLVFDKDVLNSLNSGKRLPYTGQFAKDPKIVIQYSDIPWSSIGTGKYGVLEISLYTSIYHMIPDAQKYYTARAYQLIPFYVPVTITTPTFATDGVH